MNISGKNLLGLILVLFVSIALAACGAAPEEEATPETAPEAGTSTESEAEAEETEAGADWPDELVMGFVPSTESDKIADTVEPLANQLSEILGVPVRGEVMTNYTALVEAMGSNRVQIGFLPAFGYVLASDRHEVEVILKSIRNGSDTYRAQYSVRADSGIDSIEDLEGKVWAFPDLASTSGYLFPAAQLMDEYGVEDVSAYFSDLIQAGNHDNSLITVLEGNADVATTFEDAREVIQGDYPEVMDEENGLRVIGYTAPIPNDTITIVKALPQDLIDAIRDAFLSFNDDEEMIAIMQEVYRWTGISAASDSDYDIVRSAYEKFSDSISLD